jgi:uncharacterized pyridoxal phosphate-containing UPF0001 family protein
VSDRRAQLAQSLAVVRRRIAAAAHAADREPESVTLIVVTKTFPASDVDLLVQLGVTDIGENRHPEARDKAAQVTALVTWHFVGSLQTNKARAGRDIGCFVQVSLDPPDAAAGRSGALPDDVPALAARVAAAERLTLRGVMAVAPQREDPATAFARLAHVATAVSAAHPTATDVSAGMSEDLEAAVTAGATHVRIGRAVLGERPPLG